MDWKLSCLCLVTILWCSGKVTLWKQRLRAFFQDIFSSVQSRFQFVRQYWYYNYSGADTPRGSEAIVAFREEK